MTDPKTQITPEGDFVPEHDEWAFLDDEDGYLRDEMEERPMWEIWGGSE